MQAGMVFEKEIEMNTAREKAEYWLNDNVAGWNAIQLECLVHLLKRQDRDTRHACALACLDHGSAPAIEMIDRCHDACMNVKAV